MEHFLGIDIGGTHVKMGIVNQYGIISHFDKYHTRKWIENEGFMTRFLKATKTRLDKYPDVQKVGIGIPGLLDFSRQKILEVPSIPELNGIDICKVLQSEFPNISFLIENDAGAAAVGELIFNSEAPDNFLFVTIGTGIGGAAIINRQLFIGGDGNSMEFGHIITEEHRHLEHIVAKNGIIEYAKSELSNHPTSSLQNEQISIPSLLSAAKTEDKLALSVFEFIGFRLGIGLIAAIRIMDIKEVIIGGGINVAFDFLLPGIMNSLEKYLTEYYLKDLKIHRATLGNNAGLIGAVAPFIEPTVTVLH